MIVDHSWGFVKFRASMYQDHAAIRSLSTGEQAFCTACRAVILDVLPGRQLVVCLVCPTGNCELGFSDVSISASPAPHPHSLQSKLFPTHDLSGLSHLTPSGRKYKVNSWAHMTNLRLGLLVGVVWANKMQLQSMHVPATLAERTQLSVVHRLLTIPLHT